MPASHPDNVTHDGVGLFYIGSLPIAPGNDLSFDESIVIELKCGRKIYFLQCSIEALLLSMVLLYLKASYLILEIYILKSAENLLQHFSLEITNHI